MRFTNFKRLVCTVFLPCFYVIATSQPLEITVSKTDVNASSTSIHKMFGHDGDNYFVVKFHSNQFYLEKLDSELNFVAGKAIKLNEGIKTYDFETIVHFHNKLYIIASRSKLAETVLYYQVIDKNNLLPASEMTELVTIGTIRGSWADFQVALSRQEQKLVIFCRTKLGWSNVQFNEYYVFDKDLELVWKKKDSYVFKGQGPRDNVLVVDETGNVSILSMGKKESIISLIRDIKNSYTIYRYTNDGKDFKEYPVTFEEKYIRGIKIEGGLEGELYCVGLYSEMFRPGVRGTFFFKIHPSDGRIYDQTMNKFDDGLLGRIAALKEPTIEEEELIQYKMTDLVLRDNGKLIMIAEQFFSQGYKTYNNLIVTCLDTQGQPYWSQVVEKKQDFNFTSVSFKDVEPEDYRDYIMATGTLDQNTMNYCSYALMAPQDESWIILFFNDDIKNIGQAGNVSNFNHPKKSYILAVTIDEYGNVLKQPLLQWKKRALFPVPMRYYDTLRKSIVIPAFRSRKFNYLRITATP